MTQQWLGHIKAGAEFDVEQQILDVGITAWVPRMVEIKRVGKKRQATITERPYLPNVIFMDLTPHQWHEVQTIKYLAGTMYAINRRDAEQVQAFRREVEAEQQEARNALANQQAVAEFTPGQAIEVLSGPFTDAVVTFRRMVQAAHDLHPVYEAEMDILGQKATIRVDPLDVKATTS